MAALINSHMWPVTVVQKRVFLDVFCAAFAASEFCSSGHESNKFQVSAPQWYDHISDGLAGSLGTPEGRRMAQEAEGTVRVF